MSDVPEPDTWTDPAPDVTLVKEADSLLQAAKVLTEMVEKGWFVVVWSPGEVTNGRTYFQYEQWRVHFQRGAQEVAPLIEAEGYGNADTFPEAVFEAMTAATQAWDEQQALEAKDQEQYGKNRGVRFLPQSEDDGG
jgi:hypothetical protein